MHKISNLYNPWDIKYFRWIHRQKQIAMWKDYVSYPQFRRRLESWMTLRDAIYTPCTVYQRRTRRSKTPIQDNIRRRATLREENVHIPSLDDMVAIEDKRYIRCDKHFNPIQPKQPQPTLRDRFISFFKRWQKRN